MILNNSPISIRFLLAGHTKDQTTEIYDRDMVEAHRRVMASRKIFRDKNTPKTNPGQRRDRGPRQKN